jgi:3-oxoacyl-[acyl-carrier protein] reductase
MQRSRYGDGIEFCPPVTRARRGKAIQMDSDRRDKSQTNKARGEKTRGDGVHPVSGQVAVITGAGRGIGAAIAQRLSELGATVVLCGRTRSALESRAEAIAQAGGKAEVVPCDVTSLQSVEAAVKQVKAAFGRVDILVNNAGIRGFGGPLHELAPEAWDQILNTNLRGVYYVVRTFAPMMIRARSGHIINISSLAGKNALPNGAAYAASKWGLNGLSYSLAEELRGYNIRVAVVCPGSTNTELSPHTGKDPSKMLQPEDVAHAVAMLVTQSPQSFVSEILMRPTQKP